MSTYTKSEVAKIREDCDFWKQFEHDRWRLISFTDRDTARFGWLNVTEYIKYASVDKTQVHFIKGVPPDVLDQL